MRRIPFSRLITHWSSALLRDPRSWLIRQAWEQFHSFPLTHSIGNRRNAVLSHLQRILKHAMIPRKTQISSPVIHIQRNFSLIPSLLSLSAAQVKQIYKWLRFWQVPILCQFTGPREVHVHRSRCSKRPRQEVPALLQSHAMLLAPATQHWRHLPEQARPQSGFVALRKTAATALEVKEMGYSRPPRKSTKRTNRHILQEIHCPARSTLFITNGLPCLCLRNKTK